MSHKSVLLASSAVVVAALVAMVAVLVGTAGRAEAAFPGKNGKIAFQSDRDGTQQIYRMRADGSGQRRLTHTAGDNFDPQWSANGKKILFVNCPDTTGETCGGGIYRMNADGSEEKLLEGYGFFPSWFPTWNKIAFVSYGDRSEGFGIYTMTFDASGEATRTTLLTNDGDCPVVSPDGTKIAFRSQDFDGDIWVMRAVPEGPTNQPVKIASGTDSGCYTYDWSPDGKKIAYSQSSDIFVMNADGSAKTNVTKTPDAYETSPDFSPNGKKIAFYSYRDGRSGIWKMGTDGSDPIRIPNSGRATSPDWQPLP